MLSSPSRMTLTTFTRTSRSIAQVPTSRLARPTTYHAVGTRSIGPIPVTVIPVPIATICSSSMRPASALSNASVFLSPTVLDPHTESKLPAAAIALLRLNATEANNTFDPFATFAAYDGLGWLRMLYALYMDILCHMLNFDLDKG